MIGHNQPNFDDVVEESLLRGLYLSHLNTLVCAIRDPRLGQRHLLVLAAIVERTNAKTGMAYPGRARLAVDITYYTLGEPEHYSLATVAKTVSELINFGYLIADRRAPASGGRALAHYVVTKPSVEELQAKIAEVCAQIRARGKSTYDGPHHTADDNTAGNDHPTGDVTTGLSVKTPDVTTGVFVREANGDTGGNVTTAGNVSADEYPGIPADGDTGVPTVTGTDGTGKNTLRQIDPALRTEPPANAGSESDAVAMQFDEFWMVFPPGRKEKKGETRDLFRNIVTGRHKKRRASAVALIEGAKRYAVSRVGEDRQYTKMPTTWLNGGCWEDDIDEQHKQKGPFDGIL